MCQHMLAGLFSPNPGAWRELESKKESNSQELKEITRQVRNVLINSEIAWPPNSGVKIGYVTSKTQHCARLALGLALVATKSLMQIVCLPVEHEYMVLIVDGSAELCRYRGCVIPTTALLTRPRRYHIESPTQCTARTHTHPHTHRSKRMFPLFSIC